MSNVELKSIEDVNYQLGRAITNIETVSADKKIYWIAIRDAIRWFLNED